ncbi:hypothetical protein WE348_21725 (plasmid) [Alteromonas macleodii]|uniref:hypothetical protein n=1 Tax=Alteromonas macleodii TaxID=28108 RepID=UPI0030D24A37
MTLEQLSAMPHEQVMQWIKANKENFTLVPNLPSQEFLSTLILHMPAAMDQKTADAVAKQYCEYHEEVIETTKQHFSSLD